MEDVLLRSKFDAYVQLQTRLSFLHYVRRESSLIESVPIIAACRDPKDDKFLALALTGHANFILTGDQDLLVLHPFRSIDILSPRQYLDRQQTSTRPTPNPVKPPNPPKIAKPRATHAQISSKIDVLMIGANSHPGADALKETQPHHPHSDSR